MKNILTLSLFFLSLSLFAQSDRHEKIKALKTAHITDALALTTSEAEKFWPIYNEYDEKMHALRKKERSEIYSVLKEEGVDAMSEAEANALIDKAHAIERKELEYREELIANLRKVISSKKIIKLRKAEEDFKRELLKQYRKRKKDKK
ncbi:sensor of ECF-type sigma factor [Candidatus Ulvibacter alkanivorans]|uniref:sensor of ECF-type sigma factor n=1 Tax=Candidatus Ulvibacter alkanivorans TaxID=2267620 RepID=UPI000DF1C7D0|nr:sensor of ECF-type sigma factor [Candidatus Ulvibacter alkanivorans]